MIAYHGKPEVKLEYLGRVQRHREADQLIQGYGYWKDGKGCGIGCTIHGDSHAAYETELGIPIVLARLEDGIFEALPREEAMAWPGQFLDAVPTGADLSMVWPRFAHWLLIDPSGGVLRFAKTDRTRKSITDVAALYQQWIEGKNPSIEVWRSAAYAAYAASSAAYAADAAAYAAYSAAYAAYAASSAAYAAYAADAAAYAARDTAYARDTASAASAADAAASAARSQARITQSQKLLTLLREAPVTGGTK